MTVPMVSHPSKAMIFSLCFDFFTVERTKNKESEEVIRMEEVERPFLQKQGSCWLVV